MHMFDFHYNVMLKTFEPRSIQLLYTDTDSLIYFIVHERFRRILSRIRIISIFLILIRVIAFSLKKIERF